MNSVNKRINVNKKIDKYYIYDVHVYIVLAKSGAFNLFFVNANGPVRTE